MEDFDNGIYQVRLLRDDDLDVYTFEELSYSEVEPIIITKAILEKLGFVEKDSESGSNTFEYRTADILVVYSTTLARVDILKVKEKINEAGNMIEFDLSAKILYVHQLQHLLRIVGKDFDDVELMGIYEF